MCQIIELKLISKVYNLQQRIAKEPFNRISAGGCVCVCVGWCCKLIFEDIYIFPMKMAPNRQRSKGITEPEKFQFVPQFISIIENSENCIFGRRER